MKAGSAVRSTSTPCLSLYSCLSLINSKDGPLASSVTPILLLAHTYTSSFHPIMQTHALCTHTFSLSLWLHSGRVTLEKLHYVYLGAGL